MRTPKRLLLWLHRYGGLTLGLFVLVSGVSGSVLVFGEEIEGASRPAVVHTSPDPIAAEKALAGSRHIVGPGDPALYLRMARNASAPAEIWLRSGTRILIDGHRGQVVGIERPAGTFIGFVRALHTELLLGDTGRPVLGAGGVMLCVIAATGLWLWWPGFGRLRHAIRLRAPHRWRVLLLDLHRLVGVFGLVFILIAGLTGIALAYHETFEAALHQLAGSKPRPLAPRSSPPTIENAATPLGAVASRAQAIVPDAKITWIYLPQTALSPIVVRMRSPEDPHRSGRNYLYFDRYTGDLLRVDRWTEAPLGTALYSLIYPIHTGDIGGIATRLLALIAGLAVVFLFASGVATWLARRRHRRP